MHLDFTYWVVMRRRCFQAAAVCWFVAAGAATGGLYDPAKPKLELAESDRLEALPHAIFRDRLSDVIVVGVTNPVSRFRTAALAERAELQAKPNLTIDERLRLGLLQLRMREFDHAFNELQQAYSANPRNFWALTALGTAYQQTGQISEAVRYLEAAHELQPSDLSDAARKVEAAQLKLARLRLRETAGRPGGRAPPPEDVDNLFDIQFVGPTGEYEPGTLASAEKAKLPADAIAIIQQLLMWLPDDTRLYWLLGELYSANGDLDSAQEVFDECMNGRRFDAKKLRLHRQAVRDAIAARPPPVDLDGTWMPALWRWVIAAGVAVPVMFGLAYFQFRELRRRLRTR